MCWIECQRIAASSFEIAWSDGNGCAEGDSATVSNDSAACNGPRPCRRRQLLIRFRAMPHNQARSLPGSRKCRRCFQAVMKVS